MLLMSLTTSAQDASSAPARDAAYYLEFAHVADGKCQILSAGGKLVVLRNRHPTRAIRYRLFRIFGGVIQSRVDGLLSPAGETQKLGCDTVDGRPQSWTVERAALMED